MKRKLKLIIMLFVFACLSLSVGFACSEKKEDPIAITGFEENVIVSEITVNAGDNVSIQSPLVIDENNNVMDVHVSVTDANGGFVEVKANKFFALDGNGYTIKYLVQTYDGNIHVRTTTVKVVGNYYLSADMDQVYFLNDVVTLNATHRLDNPAISYAVKDPDGADVTLTGNTFVAEKAGFYELTITALEAGKTHTYQTQIYVYEYTADYSFGAVEIFDENWETIRKLSGYGMQNWSLTHSDECGILSYKGTPDYLIKATTKPGWNGGLDFWLNPLFSKENYEGLLAKGYNKIIIPIYLDGNVDSSVYNFTTGHVQNNTSYMYQVHNCGLSKNAWKLVEFRLGDTYNDWQRSFLSSYEIYARQIAQFIRISGTSGDLTFYMGSIYAMKDVTVSHSYTQSTLDVGTEVDFSKYVTKSDDFELEYAVTFRGKTDVLSEDQLPYRFSANGEYSVNIYPKSADLNGQASFTVNVIDGVELSFSDTSDVEYPRDPAGVRIVKFSDLGMILTDKEGNIISDVSYEVQYDGKVIDSAEEDFVAAKDGKYTVFAIGKYGDNLVSYKDVKVNIYSVTELGMVDRQETAFINIVDSINTKMEYEVPKAFTAYKIVKIIGTNEILIENDGIISDAGMLDTSKLVNGYYKVYATDTNDVDELVFFDLWDSAEGHFWSTVSETGIDYVQALGNFYQKKLGYAYKDDKFTEKAVEIVEHKGKMWYKYDHTDNYDLFFTNGQEFSFKQSVGFEIKPLHSKSYYEELNELGYKVVFDFMFVKSLDEGNTSTYSNFVYHNTGWSQKGNLDSNVIHTFEGDLVQLNALLANWDYIQSGTTDIGDSYKNAFIANYWAAWNNADQTGVKDIQMYISDIRIDAKATVKTEFYLADADGNYKDTADDVVTEPIWLGGGIANASDKIFADRTIDWSKTTTTTKKNVKPNETVEFKVYLKNIPTKNLGLVSVVSNSTIDIDATLNEFRGVTGEYTGYKLYNSLASGDVLIENAPLTDGVVTITGFEGNYYVEVIAEDGELYRVRFDAYNPNKPAWNIFNESSVVIYQMTDGSAFKTGTGTMEKATKDGQEIDVIRFVKSDMNSHNWYVHTPLRDKSFYESMRGQGYVLRYYLYVDLPVGVKGFNQLLGYGAQIDTDASMSGKWHEMKVTLDKYLDNWDNYTNPTNYKTTGSWGTRNSYGMAYMYNPCHADSSILITAVELVKA